MTTLPPGRTVPRDILKKALGNPRLVQQIEALFRDSQDIPAAINSLASAPYVAVASDAAIPNARVLTGDTGLTIDISVDGLVALVLDVIAALGYTPINKAGDSGIGPLSLDDTLDVTGDATVQGDVGVGTNAPAAPLDVQESGTVLPTLNAATIAVLARAAAAASGCQLAIISGNAGSARIFFGDTDDEQRGAVFYSNLADALSLWTAGSQRVTIDSAGAVGINEGAPDYKLDVNGSFGFTPGNSVNPVDVGDIVFQFTNDTTITMKGKGSDGNTRSIAFTIA